MNRRCQGEKRDQRRGKTNRAVSARIIQEAAWAMRASSGEGPCRAEVEYLTDTGSVAASMLGPSMAMLLQQNARDNINPAAGMVASPNAAAPDRGNRRAPIAKPRPRIVRNDKDRSSVLIGTLG